MYYQRFDFKVLMMTMLLAFFISCKSRDPEKPEKIKVDSVLDEGAEKVKEANQGVKEGYDEAKDEIEEVKDTLNLK